MGKLFAGQKSDATWKAVNLLSQADVVETDATTVCYFMVEHISDEEFMDALAACLIKSGCREFVFWGEERNKWHFAFDLADIRLNPDFDDDTIAITSDCLAWQDLVEEIITPIVVTGFSPTQFILFYDDAVLYEQLCRDCEAYVRDNKDI